MSDIDEIKKWIEKDLGQTTEMELERNGKIIKLKVNPLPVEKLPELYSLLKAFEGSTVENPKMNITKEWLDTVGSLGLEILKPNYPDIEDSKLKELVLRNAVVFANEIITQNLAMAQKPQIKIKERIDAIKKSAKQKTAKSA